ncbi:MAG: hypothetical protein ACYTGV_19300 [Planctomycetota bacterium]|jgi:hypothetical protein
MVLARRILPSVLALAVVLVACGKDEPKGQLAQRQATPDDLGKLVPADAVGFFRFAPLDQLQPKMRELIGYFDERQAQKFDVAELFKMAGVPAERIDRSKPVGTAVVLVDAQMRPMPTFILPVTEPDKPIAGRTLVRSGSYVAVGTAGDPEVGSTTPALAKDLPEGDVAVRWDAQRLVAAFRPVIEPYLSAEAVTKMAPQLAAQPRQNLAMLDAMADWVRKLMDSAGSMEGAIDFSEGKLDLTFGMSVLEGSPMDKPGVEGGVPLMELSKRIDAAKYPMVVLAYGDMGEMIDALMPVYEAMMAEAAEEQRAKFLAYMEKSKKVYELMGPSFVMGADFGTGGLEMVAAAAPEDPAGYVDAYREIVLEGSFPEMGIAMSVEDPVEIEGVKFDRFSMTFDWNKLMASGDKPMSAEQVAMVNMMLTSMFGEGGWQFAHGAAGDTAVVAAGKRENLLQDAARTAKRRSGTLPAAVQGALTEDTGFLVYLDFRRLFSGVMGLVASATGEEKTIASTPAVDLWLRASAEGRDRTLAVHIDIEGFSKLAKEMR